MRFRDIEKHIVLGSRYLSLAAVMGSLAGSVLMFFLGLFNIYRAFAEGLQVPTNEEDDTGFGSEAVISVIEGLDRFLIAIVLLYFAYGFPFAKRDPRVEPAGDAARASGQCVLARLCALDGAASPQVHERQGRYQAG